MNLAIGAVFRNELDYILEWVCWHRLAGFKEFYIVDNGSNDGTRELLEALSDTGLVKLLYQPIIEKHAQIIAYQRITQVSLNKTDAILFIDADEFLVHESIVEGAEYQYLCDLLQDPDVGMIAINWRCFGSSGLVSQDERPVVERFINILSDDVLPSKNQYIKSISKINFIKSIHCHNSVIYDKKYFNAQYAEIKDFKGVIYPSRGSSGVTQSIIKSPLRVNHYVIKSKQEFKEKKEKRGDAMLGTSYTRGLAYFEAHDFKDEYFYLPKEKILRLNLEINQLKKVVQNTLYSMTLSGCVDINNRHEIQGWLINEIGSSKSLKVNIFVNSVYQGVAECGFYRPDLKEKAISIDGFCGFRWTHPFPLKSGDKVEVYVHANCYKFPKNANIHID